MLRFTSLALFALLLSSGLAAQLAGSYELKGKPKVTLEIRKITSAPPTFVAAVYADDQILPNETMFIWPTPTGWAWENAAGNSGTITQKPNGDLEATVTTGPNAGKKTTWEKK